MKRRILAPSAGVAKGENAKPTPSAPSREADEKEEQKTHHTAKTAAFTSPLGGWPGLKSIPNSNIQTVVVQRSAPIDTEDLFTQGDNVKLVGSQAKNGALGTLVKKCNDGKWKVRLQD